MAEEDNTPQILITIFVLIVFGMGFATCASNKASVDKEIKDLKKNVGCKPQFVTRSPDGVALYVVRAVACDRLPEYSHDVYFSEKETQTQVFAGKAMTRTERVNNSK